MTQKNSVRKAFAVALRLAEKHWLDFGPLAWLDHFVDTTPDEVEVALGYSEPAIDVEDWIDVHVHDKDLAMQLCNSIVHERAMTQQAAFIYGVAVGLTFGRGGPR